MPYLLLILGLIIGAYALYRFFINADPSQIKSAFMVLIIFVLCLALFVLSVTGRLPAALGLLGALVPLAMGWLKARHEVRKGMPPPDLSEAIKTRKDALAVLGLDENASIDDIHDAYKRLMKAVHPDHEGSEWMAAKLNLARDLLLKD